MDAKFEGQDRGMHRVEKDLEEIKARLNAGDERFVELAETIAAIRPREWPKGWLWMLAGAVVLICSRAPG
jgi:hypothetical protein